MQQKLVKRLSRPMRKYRGSNLHYMGGGQYRVRARVHPLTGKYIVEEQNESENSNIRHRDNRH